MSSHVLPGRKRPLIQYLYWGTVFMLTLTGFAQMPIFKRYYIADIPGFGWLAQFYVTHYLHYLFSIVLLGLISYAATDFFIDRQPQRRITRSGTVRILILAGLVLTGILLVVKNFSGYLFSPGWIIVMIILHFVFVMALLLHGLACLLFRKKWLQAA